MKNTKIVNFFDKIKKEGISNNLSFDLLNVINNNTNFGYFIDKITKRKDKYIIVFRFLSDYNSCLNSRYQLKISKNKGYWDII